MFKKIKPYILPVLVGPFFLGTGIFKLMGAEEMQTLFSGFGLPLWFMYVTGIIEVAGAIGLFFHKTRFGFFAPALLAITMIVATGFHIVNDPFVRALPAMGLFLVMGYLAFARRNLVFGARQG